MEDKAKLILRTSEKDWRRIKIYYAIKGEKDINKIVNELIQKGLDSEDIQNVN